MRRWVAVPSLAAVVCLTGAVAVAVRPESWVHTAEAHFAPGKFAGAVCSSLGEITLARQVKVLMPADTAPPVVSCITLAGRTIYAGSGSEPAIYRIDLDRDQKPARFAELPSAVICCLHWTGQELLAGAGGDEAGIYRIDGGGKAHRLWSDPSVKYVWAIVANPAGGLFAATGPEGKVFAVSLAAGEKGAKAQVVYAADGLAKNILSLAAGRDRRLYAGTDQRGLVVEIDLKAKSSRILLDAAEQEIAALIVGEGGEVYAGTADAAKAAPEGAKQPAPDRAGKPDGATRPAATRPASAATEPASRLAVATRPQAPPAKKPEGTTRPSAGKDKPKPQDRPAKAENPQLPGGKPGDPPGPAGDQPKTTPPAGEQGDGEGRKGRAGDAGGDASGSGPPFDSASAARAGRTRPDRPAGVATSPGPGPRNGELPPPPSGPSRMVRMGTPQPGAPAGPPAAPPPAQGNAVYRIRPDGMVETVFRRPVTVLSMVIADGRLLLGTGNGGGIYAVGLDGEDVALLADTDAKQVTALARSEDGAVYFATANRGAVGRLENDHARKGTFISPVLDAKQLAQWGTIQLDGAAPAGSSVTIATRSGNVEEADDKTWGTWSKEMPLESGYLPIGSPAGRFLQYRLTLAGDGKATPVIRGVEIVYQVGNLPPVVSAVTVEASERGRSGNPETPGAKVFRHITIQAADQNGDNLRVSLAFREIGAEAWIPIIEKVPGPKFIWDTRGVGDGRYELRVTASDDPSNPASTALEGVRISNPIVVDNTPPLVRDLLAKAAAGSAALSGEAFDATSRIVAIQYAVDSQSEWVALLPADGICDSGREKFAFEVKDLKPGPHRVAVSATDELGNVGYAAVTVNVPK